jgi:hypothetical protein
MSMSCDLINALGGDAVLAAKLGIGNYRVVKNWKGRGIPWRWRPAVAKLAKRARVALPTDFLEPNSDAA